MNGSNFLTSDCGPDNPPVLMPQRSARKERPGCDEEGRILAEEVVKERCCWGGGVSCLGRLKPADIMRMRAEYDGLGGKGGKAEQRKMLAASHRNGLCAGSRPSALWHVYGASHNMQSHADKEGLKQPPHGLANVTPANFNSVLFEQVSDHLRLWSRLKPEMTSRRVTGVDEGCGLRGLHLKFIKDEEKRCKDAGLLVPKSILWATFRSYAWRMMVLEGTTSLLPAKLGHNVCSTCKDFFFLRERGTHNVEGCQIRVRDAEKVPLSAGQAVLEGAKSDLEAAKAELKVVEDGLQAHRNHDTVQRRAIAQLMRWGIEMATARGLYDPPVDGAPVPEPPKPNTVDGVLVVHVDGEASRQIPKVRMQTGTESMTGFRRGQSGGKLKS